MQEMIDVAEEKSAYLSNFSTFEKSALVRATPWLYQTRKAAISRFDEVGFPSTREEDWRYTNVAPVTRIPFKPASRHPNGVTPSDLAAVSFGEMECCQLVFLDGHFSEGLSSLETPSKSARVMSLAAALENERCWVEPNLARHASIRGSAFTALNTAFMADGAFVYLPPGTHLKQTIHLLFISTATAPSSVSFPRNLFVLGSGSQVDIVETYVGLRKGVYFTNAVSEVIVGEGCHVDHYKLQRENEEAFHIQTMHAVLERDSSFSSHTLSIGGSLVRNDVDVVLNGEGAECTLNGLYVTKGKQHVDNHTSIDHASPHCDSRELYKGILDGRSSAVFNGKVVVRKDAQKTNARQTNKNLLLSEDAVVNTTPQLEIRADDVKCTHGATIGQLDEKALFYMRSRGIDKAAARTLLTYAFASEVLGSVKIKPIQCQIDLVLLSRLSRESAGILGEV